MINTQEYIEQLVKPFQEMATIDGKEFILHNDATLEVPIDEKKSIKFWLFCWIMH